MIWEKSAFSLKRRLNDRTWGFWRRGSPRVWKEVTREMGTIGCCRTAFFARPFRPAFATVEKWLVELLWSRGILIRNHDHLLGEPLRIEEIALEIRSADFGIADVTRCTPNVRMEVGMMVALQKKVLLLQRGDDHSAQPFDLRGLQLVRYTLTSGIPRLSPPPDAGHGRRFEQVLDEFVEKCGTLSVEQAPSARGARAGGPG